MKHDRYFFMVKKSFRPTMIRQRKQFMDLFMKAMVDDQEAIDTLYSKYGVKLMSQTVEGSDVTLIVDGEPAYKLR